MISYRLANALACAAQEQQRFFRTLRGAGQINAAVIVSASEAEEAFLRLLNAVDAEPIDTSRLAERGRAS